ESTPSDIRVWRSHRHDCRCFYGMKEKLMARKQKRDNAYYEKQLQKLHPSIHADYLAGKYPSLNQALHVAGIRKPRTRLSELKNAWEKAQPTEQRQFLQWLQKQGALRTPLSGPVSSNSVVAADRRLESWAIARIEEVMMKLNLKMGDVMHQMGFKKLNPSLGNAMRQ